MTQKFHKNATKHREKTTPEDTKTKKGAKAKLQKYHHHHQEIASFKAEPIMQTSYSEETAKEKMNRALYGDSKKTEPQTQQVDGEETAEEKMNRALYGANKVKGSVKAKPITKQS